jgi:hypothetical protein
MVGSGVTLAASGHADAVVVVKADALQPETTDVE